MVLADIYDAINTNTLGTGQWRKGKAPKFPDYPRPGARLKKKKTTVKDLFARFGGARRE